MTQEFASISSPELLFDQAHYSIKHGNVTSTSGRSVPAIASDRLALVNFAGDPGFRPLYDALCRIQCYNLNPAVMAQPRKSEAFDNLLHDGSNIAGAIRSLQRNRADFDQIIEYLSEIVPGVESVSPKQVDTYETLEFRQRLTADLRAWKFSASSMSDGTLRALGALVALFQSGNETPLLIGLEEPEAAVHPAALSVLLRAILVASQHRQLLITSHSPDLLDDQSLPVGSVFVADKRRGATIIGPVDRASQSAIKRGDFTVGDLLRQDQLELELGPDLAPLDVEST
ncbi:MAG: AAA family ATPase [Fimbriimonadaceae bacterium]|nr:AAA family ATPase [Fimbriimonadaceae bacterium]